MKYEEFAHLKMEVDEKNPFCPRFVLPSGECFYLEPVFYTQLQGFKDLHKEQYHRIIDEMIRLTKKNKRIVFVGTFEYPQTEVDDSYIFLEITDVTDPLHIFVEDKSRGSDYGD